MFEPDEGLQGVGELLKVLEVTSCKAVFDKQRPS